MVAPALLQPAPDWVGPPESVLPLTPELDSLFDHHTPEAWQAFIDGRKTQVAAWRRGIAAHAAPRDVPG